MIDFNKPVRTIEGKEVRIYATDGAGWPIHGAIKLHSGWVLMLWDISGETQGDHQQRDTDNLENIPTKHVKYFNMYKGYSYSTRKIADENDSMYEGERLACVRVEFEEGQFDN